MKHLGSKTLETERLILRKTEENDLKRLWEILWMDNVSKYYLTCKINENWEKEKYWQYKKLERANNPDVYCWTIELKENHTVIGQISVQDLFEPKEGIRDIGWFLDPNYQKKGYMKEASREVLKYMFLEVELNSIETSAAIDNPASWLLMEKLGFKRLNTTHFVKYTFLEEETEVYEYICNKKDFLKKYFYQENLYITLDIDKEPYMNHLTDDPVINITGESGSGKSTMIEDYPNKKDCIIIDTDLLYHNPKGDCKKLQDYLLEKYKELPDLCLEFDKVYQDILEYFKNSGKIIIIDSAQYRNCKDLSILKGEIIILRTCVNTCYQRCIDRFQKKNKNASLEELGEYTEHKRNIYKWYHLLNSFIERIDSYREEE